MSIIIRDKIVKQLNESIENIIKLEEIEEKLFYIDMTEEIFSSALFFDNNKQYKAIHFVFNIIYNTCSRIWEQENHIPPFYFNNLTKYMTEIVDGIINKKNINDTLIEMLILTFSITPYGSFFEHIKE